MRPIATLRSSAAPEGGSSAPEFWREYWPRLAELGIFRVAVPEEAGGAGGTVGDLAVLIEQAAHDLVGGPVLSTALAGLVTGEALDEITPCGVALTGEIAISVGESGVLVSGEWDSVAGAAPGTAVLVPVRDGERHLWALIDADAPGLRVEPLAGLDPSVPLAKVVCADVAVPADRLFAPEFDVLDAAATLAAAELAG
ncbi:acyl-CoA dehydrogenase family protein, partial [Nocardia sp. NPDC004722]